MAVLRLRAAVVSNHALEQALQSYSTISDAICFGYQDAGHQFYVMSFPTANKTWVFDTVETLGMSVDSGLRASANTNARITRVTCLFSGSTSLATGNQTTFTK